MNQIYQSMTSSGASLTFVDLCVSSVRRPDGYSSKDIKYTWKEGPIDSVAVNYDLQLPQFTINGYKTNERLIELSTGDWFDFDRIGLDLFSVM